MSKRLLWLVTVATFTVLSISQSLAAQTLSAEQVDSLRAFVKRGIAEHSIPGLAVAVVSGGRIVWEEGFGLADKGRGTPVTARTVFAVASVSKPLTATGLMVLVQHGRVALDAPANVYLKGPKIQALVGREEDATPRRLANHTAGLGGYWHFYYDSSMVPILPDKAIAHYGVLVYPPGDHFEYSNLGYGILGDLISQVTGESFQRFMTAHVFAPLGMSATSVGVEPKHRENVAVRYDFRGSSIPFYRSDHAGASDVYSTVHDLARFAMFQLRDHLADQAAILDDSHIDAMHIPSVATGAHSGYAIGWRTQAAGPRCTIVEHGGAMDGAAAALVLVPGNDVGVAILSNSRNDFISAASHKILQAICHCDNDGSMEGDDERGRTFSSVRDTNIAGTWVGSFRTYMGSSEMRLTVERTGKITVWLAGQPASIVRDVRIRGDILYGSVAVPVPDSEIDARPYSVLLALRVHGNTMTGSGTAVSLGRRDYFALPHWVELARQSP